MRGGWMCGEGDGCVGKGRWRWFAMYTGKILCRPSPFDACIMCIMCITCGYSPHSPHSQHSIISDMMQTTQKGDYRAKGSKILEHSGGLWSRSGG